MRIAITLAALWMAADASGSQVVHFGQDFGAGPGESNPNTTAAQSAFRTAIGANPVINFENLDLGHFGSIEVSPGVVATLTGTDDTPPAGFHYGIASDHPDVLWGYNTSISGAKFLRFTPQLDVGTATLTLDFNRPIVAFGFTVSGLGTDSGSLYVSHGNGPGDEHALAGDDSGGILFFGISDLTAQTSRVTLQLRSVTGLARDVFSLDDFRFKWAPEGSDDDPPTATETPEPSTILLAALGFPAIVAYLRRRAS